MVLRDLSCERVSAGREGREFCSRLRVSSFLSFPRSGRLAAGKGRCGTVQNTKTIHETVLCSTQHFYGAT